MIKLLIRLTMVMLLCIGLDNIQADGRLNKSPPFHLSNGSASLDVIIESHIIYFTDNDSSSSLNQRLHKLQELLNTYFEKHPRESEYSFSFGLYPELNARMASLVSCSPQWNSQTGRSTTKDTAGWLRDQLNQESAYHELITVFETFGYQVKIASMESINLCHSAEIDWTNTLRSCHSAISLQAKLPCGALLTFTLNLIR